MGCGGNCNCEHGAKLSEETVAAPPPPVGDLPAPIPWLGVAGEVRAIDTALSLIPPQKTAAAKDVLSTRPDAISAAQVVQKEMHKRTAARLSAAASELGLNNPREDVIYTNSAVIDGGVPLPAKPARPKKLDPSRPGSGIPARLTIRVLVWVRRFAQAGFLALFLYFLFQTTFRGNFTAKAASQFVSRCR